MTVSTTSNRIVYTGNGATTAFAFPYKFIAPTDIKVYVGSVLQASGYTVGTPSDTGANVTFSSAPANGAAIIILSDPARLQGTSLPSTGPFPAKSVETMADKLTLLVQRLADLVSRSFTLSDADSTTASTVVPTPVANTIIGWNATGNALQNVPVSSLATAIAYGGSSADIFTGTGAQTVFTLSSNPGSQANLDVSISGVTQLPGTDYVWGGGTILTFTTAPVNAAKILVRYQTGLLQGTADAGSVTYSDAATYGSASVGGRLKQLISSIGSSLVGFFQAGTGAVARTAQDKMRESVSVKDFGATGDGISDDTAAIQAAINYVQAFYKPETYGSSSPGPGVAEVVFPFGVYKLTSALSVSRSVSFKGEGHSEFSIGARIIQNTAATDHFTVAPIAQGCSVSWDDLTMTANGGGGTGGSCINITRTTAACNSVRVRGCTFGTPQTYAIKIQSSDDVMIHDNLFDVSATSCIGLGTSTAADVVSNCCIRGNTFYSIASFGVLAYNVTGLLIEGNRVYPSAANLGTFLDGYNTLPYQIKNVVVTGNNFKGVNCVTKLTGVVGFVFQGNNGVSLGAGAGASLSCVELTGTCSNINITGNVLSGAFDTKNFYNDAGATVSATNIGENTFVNTSGTGAALVASNTAGSIKQSTLIGFSAPSIGEQIYTSGNAISVGVIGSLGSATFTKTITGARQGDRVNLTPASTTWPAPAGIVISAFVSAANTVSIQYTNVTGSAIGVPAHDFGILITR